MIEATRLSAFTTYLRCLSATERADAIAGAIMESGGTFSGGAMSVFNSDTEQPCDSMIEISLHGATAWGTTIDSAVSNWITAATRLLEESAAA